MWHKADWDEVKRDPTKIQFPREDWIFQHDAEQHAEDNFKDSFDRVRRERGSEASNGAGIVKAHL
jgi:hypothetical protein